MSHSRKTGGDDADGCAGSGAADGPGESPHWFSRQVPRRHLRLYLSPPGSLTTPYQRSGKPACRVFAPR